MCSPITSLALLTFGIVSTFQHERSTILSIGDVAGFTGYSVGWGYIGDEILPSYIGIVINHYKDPY